METFGEFFRALRQRQELTQCELADRVGVHFTYISKIENDQLTVLPSEVFFYNVAACLNVDAEMLMECAGKINVKQLQQIAMHNPRAAFVLRRLPQASSTTWLRIGNLLAD